MPARQAIDQLPGELGQGSHESVDRIGESGGCAGRAIADDFRRAGVLKKISRNTDESALASMGRQRPPLRVRRRAQMRPTVRKLLNLSRTDDSRADRLVFDRTLSL